MMNGPFMDLITLDALADFPRRLEAYYGIVPAEHKNWRPHSWEGVPSEPFTPIEQLCHVRDIEIDGYHVRLRRALREERPVLAAIDGAALARERGYATADAARVCSSFRVARGETVRLIAQLGGEQLERTAIFAEHG